MLEKEVNKLQNKDLSSSNIHFKNHQMVYDYVEKLPTIQKIFIVQTLLKEMISIKDRFEDNKEKMKEKIEDNCYKYFKNILSIKEIFDYCESKKPEVSLNYILFKNTDQILYSFEEARKDFIEKFFLDLRNNYNFMLKIINVLDEKDFGQLSYFLVHFLYENTIDSSSKQDELMLMTYLIFENIIITKQSYLMEHLELNRNNFLYHYLKAFTRKTDIRNYLCSNLHDIFLDLEKENNILHCNIKTIYDSMFKGDEKDKIPLNLDALLKKNSLSNEKPKEKIDKVEKKIHRTTIYYSTRKNDNLYNNDNRISVGLSKSKNGSNNYLDDFFQNNDVTEFMLSQKLTQLNNNKSKTDIELAYMYYISSCKNKCYISKKDFFSNKILLKNIKQTNINEKNISFEALSNIYKYNYNKIIKYIDKIMENISNNIKTLPYSIKFMFYILNYLLGKIYYNKANIEAYQYHQIFFIKLRVFFGGFILFNINNPLYNGIVSDDIISQNTFENLKIIHTILAKIFSGNLFEENDRNKDYIIFNKYIYDKIPFFLKIIKNIDNYIQHNFEPPLFIKNLLSPDTKCNDKNISYDYFELNKDENIRCQSICFSASDLMMFVNVIKKLLKSNIIKKEQQSSNLELLLKYNKIFEDINLKDKKENKKQYVVITEFTYRESFLKEIKSVTEDHFENYFKMQSTIKNTKEVIQRVKKCLIEILIYISKLHKENFNSFIKRKDELTLSRNSFMDNFSRHNKLSLYHDIFEGDNRYFVNSKTGSIHKKRHIKQALAEDTLEDANFLNEIFPKLMHNIKYEIGNNYDNAKLQQIIFCVSYLQIHLKNLPIDYVHNNYNKLFMNIMYDVEKLIKSLQTNNILNQFHLKIREGDNLNIIMSKYSSEIKNMEKYYYISYFFNKLTIPDPFKPVKGKQQSTQMINSILKESIDLSITSFIQNFPDYRRDEREVDDIIEEENKKGIPDVLKSYFKDMKNKIKNEKLSSKFSPFEFLSICYELENYILFKLYEKIYPTIPSKKDNFICKKCCRLHFIKPENYIKDKKMINANILQTVMEYINDMDKKYTPVDKIKMFGKAFSILHNFMAFNSGKTDLGVDDTLPLLVFVVIKSQPKMINTNYNFCKNYINPELDKKQYGMLLMQIGMVIKIINDMKHTDLIGVTEEQFGSDKEVKHHIRRAQNLQPKYTINH